MTTIIGAERGLLDMLNNLIHLDFDAIEAYQSAIDRLNRADDKTHLIAFKGDHERHAQELASQSTSGQIE